MTEIESTRWNCTTWLSEDVDAKSDGQIRNLACTASRRRRLSGGRIAVSSLLTLSDEYDCSEGLSFFTPSSRRHNTTMHGVTPDTHPRTTRNTPETFLRPWSLCLLPPLVALSVTPVRPSSRFLQGATASDFARSPRPIAKDGGMFAFDNPLLFTSLSARLPKSCLVC